MLQSDCNRLHNKKQHFIKSFDTKQNRSSHICTIILKYHENTRVSNVKSKPIFIKKYTKYNISIFCPLFKIQS